MAYFKAGKHEFEKIPLQDVKQIQRVVGFSATYIYWVLDTRNPRKNERVEQVAERYFDIKTRHDAILDEQIADLIREFSQPENQEA